MIKMNESEEEKKIFVIKNGTLIDGTGSDPVENGVVVTEDSKILQVGNEGDVEIPEGAEVIDAGGKTIMPGMIELHAHIASWWTKPDANAYDDALMALLAARCLRESLDAGITTVRDVGTSNKVAYSVRRAIEQGLIEGSRVLVCGPIIAITGGHGTGIRGMKAVDGPWECRKAVREQLALGADHIKICTTHRPWRGNEEFTMEELRAIVEEAHKQGKKVAAHAALMPGMRMAVEAGIDTIEHGMSEMPHVVDDETVELMAEKGSIWVPTLWVFLRERTEQEQERREMMMRMGPQTKEMRESRRWMDELKEHIPENFKKALKAGIRIGTGADVGLQGYDVPFVAVPEEMELLCKHGLPNRRAIMAATSVAAEACGREEDLGTLEEGKLADIIVVDGNPLEDIGAMKKALFVMKEGKIHKNLLT